MKKYNYQYFDCIIVGAGPVGCVLAERLSTELKLSIALIDKRNHIAGNCYDYINKSGVLVHKYGPHYFRTNNKSTIKYLKKFTDFIPGEYIVKSYIKKKLYDFPINLNTLEKFFKKKFNKKSAKKYLNEIKTRIKNPHNFEDYLTNKIGKKLYDDFYKNYTIKQWNKSPKELSANLAKRIPIRFDRNNRYVNHKYQIMPKLGFTNLFSKMIANPKITLMLKADYFKLQKNLKFKKLLIYTGPVDRYFDYKYGKLDWRSLIFKFKNFKKKFYQKNVQINYPNNYGFTRIVEIKHVTKQKINLTTICKEYPASNGDPYYPIMTVLNKNKFIKYRKLCKQLEKKNIFFIGRLAEYTYINTDEAIEKALKLFLKIKNRLIS